MSAVRSPALALALASLAVACGGGDAASVPASGTADAAAPGPGPGPAPPGDAGAPPGDAAPPGQACTGKSGKSGDRTVKITSGGRERTFELHVPAKIDASVAAPLVFAFHGFTMTPGQIGAASQLGAASDARGFIVAFPAGVGTSFNAGDCCGTAASQKVDDVGFTRDMITAISAEHCVDAKRTYATGFSNGGFLSYRIACELSETIAAVAPVAGVLGLDPGSCTPKRPVPLMHVHGTGDLLVPYDGGGVSGFRSVATTIDAWKAKNAATGAGQSVYAKGDVTCTQWSGGADVRLCKVEGGGHQWPGGQQLPYGGSPSPDLDATSAMLDFFDAHPMP